MYQIYADGVKMYESGGDASLLLISPKATLDVNSVPTLSFTIPPGNVRHGKLQKLKTIITVLDDGDLIFRGRVRDITTDFYNQQSVYCDGDRAFLNDSLYPPYEYDGNVRAFFNAVIENHNAKVNLNQRFTVGTVTAVSGSLTMKIQDSGYSETASLIQEKLLDAYGGYLRTRTVDGVTYIDWMTGLGSTNQSIEFSVNLLDLQEKADAGDVFTCLIPLGAAVKDSQTKQPGDNLTIASVNGGKIYLQNDEAVAKYGKIWRKQAWTNTEDPAQLKRLGENYLSIGAQLHTLTIRAVDMHFTNGNIQKIRIGNQVHILSDPHGIDRTEICSQISLDLVAPENNSYTFGVPEKSLTENMADTRKKVRRTTGRGGDSGDNKTLPEINDKIRDIEYWANYYLDKQNGQFNIVANRTVTLTGEMTELGIDVDAQKEEIKLKAAKSVVNDLGDRVTKAEAQISIQSDEISLKVSKNGIISAINQSAESITINASKINLEGYVKASSLASDIASLERVNVKLLASARGGIDVYNVATKNFKIGDDDLSTLASAYKKVEKTVSGDNITLTFTQFNGKTDEVTFNKAGSTIKPTLTGTWASGILTVTSTPSPASKLYFYLGKGSTTWDENTATVEITSAPSSGVQGTTVYKTTVNANGRYEAGRTDGWSGCKESIEVSPAENKTMAYGEELTVHVKCKSTKTATSTTDVKTVKITAPAASGGNASNIELSSFSFVGSAAGSSSVSGRTRLSTIGSLISSNKNSNGYILFTAKITGGTGSKLYYIPIGSV